MSIPKIIHYCWYGHGSKPECFEKCYASWKTYAPDYEIIEWNESNSNLEENSFMMQAYSAGKYAFVSDIARLRVLLDYGGVYLDTDVELFSSLDDLLDYSSFFFRDSFGKIGTGFGFGSQAHNPLLEKILSDYESYQFSPDKVKELLCTDLNTLSCASYFPDFLERNITQIMDHNAFFSTYDYAKYAKHHYTATWRNAEDTYAERFAKKHWPLRRLHPYLRSPKIFAFFHRHKLYRLERLYAFLVYDFIIYGAVYYCYKLIRKIQKKLFPHIGSAK